MQDRHLASPWLPIVATVLALACGTMARGAPAAVPKSPAVPGPHVPVEGTDYTTIDTPDRPSGARVQLVEVFGYGCHFCAALQPDLAKWKKTLPADVEFRYLAAPFGGLPDAFMRAFYAAQAIGVQEKSHDGIFKAVFDDKRVATADDVPKLYADYGIDPKVFAATMQSFAVSSRVAAAHDQVIRWGIEGTPTLVVDGKYRVMELKSGDSATMFRTVEWLIAHQRPAHTKS
jgi:thiol:disulfide interchange protein DsbA